LQYLAVEEQETESGKETLSSVNQWRRIPKLSADSLSSLPSLTPLPASSSKTWCLGIDLGTTGVSAVLLNRSTKQVYPISWLTGEESKETEPNFRLSTAVEHQDLPKNWKRYLKVTLPYYSSQTGKWEPRFRWSKIPTNADLALQNATLVNQVREIDLSEMLQTVQTILTKLSPAENTENLQPGLTKTPETSYFTEGLSGESLSVALTNLSGVIVSCPGNWSEAYRFNIRECVLASGLVNTPEQICFLSEAIASLLAELHLSLTNQLTTEENPDQSPTIKHQIKSSKWLGATLVLHSGATNTELALVNLPENLENLTYQNFTLRNFPYAGYQLDQDIVFTLLLSPESNFSLITDLARPLPGEPDLATRHQLEMRLESTTWGRNLLEAANYVKLILQLEESFSLTIGEDAWEVKRQDLENRVFSRFIQSLNREVNTLLVQAGMSVEAIGQVLCTGGTAGVPSLADWLRQKFPNATLKEDDENFQLYPAKVALGLAVLPLYPQLLDDSQQQYNDYFLLEELLLTFSEETLSVGKIINLLERKGINTSACQQRLFAFLAGDLPAGLIPAPGNEGLLTEESWQNQDYQALRKGKLFDKLDNQTYRLNLEYSIHLYRYLAMLTTQTYQKLEEPYSVYWLTPVDE